MNSDVAKLWERWRRFIGLEAGDSSAYMDPIDRLYTANLYTPICVSGASVAKCRNANELAAYLQMKLEQAQHDFDRQTKKLRAILALEMTGDAHDSH